jgi:hypothetical protein
MTAQHTPSPWEFEAGERYGSIYGEDANGRDWNICDLGPPIAFICDCPEDLSQDIRDQAAANARLIVTAPDMLAELRRAAAQFRFYEQQHRAKVPEIEAGAVNAPRISEALVAATLAKAEANSEFAKRIEALIARATEVSS